MSRIPPAARRVGKRIATAVPAVVDAYRFATAPRAELTRWRDFVESMLAWRGVRRLPRPRPGARPALLALFRDDVFDIKLYGVVATALRARGVPVVVKLSSRRATRARRFFEALDLGIVCFDEDDIPSADEERSLREQVAALDDLRGFASWASATLNGFEAGPLLLSTVIRQTENGHPHDDDAVFFRRVRDRVPLAALAYWRAKRALERWHPSVVVVQEPGYDTNGPLVDIACAEGVRVVHVATSWRDDALLLKAISAKRRRVLPQTAELESVEQTLACWDVDRDNAVSAAFAARYGGAWALQSTFQHGVNEGGPDLRSWLGVGPERKVAVIFSHVLWDATFWAGTDLYRDYAAWLVAVARAAVGNPALHWVIKAHPANRYRYAAGDVHQACAEEQLIREAFPQLPPHVTVMPADMKMSSLAVYQSADYGLTVRGSPGFEMACFGKPVLTAGTGAYVGFGFTHDSRSVAEFERRLSGLHELGPIPADWMRRARAYAFTLFERRPWRLTSFDMTFSAGGRRKVLDRNITPRRTWEPIDAAHDLMSAATWMTSSEAIDYLGDNLDR